MSEYRKVKYFGDDLGYRGYIARGIIKESDLYKIKESELYIKIDTYHVYNFIFCFKEHDVVHFRELICSSVFEYNRKCNIINYHYTKYHSYVSAFKYLRFNEL